MMNLLPQDEKRIVQNEYRARVLTIALLAVFVTIVAAVVLLVPSYIIASITQKDMQEQRAQLEAQADEEQDIAPRRIIEKTNERISVLKGESNTLVAEDITQPIVERRQSISITHMQYNRNPEGMSMVRVSGIAPSRDDLLSFVDRLEKHSAFESVNVPVSNFVSAVNIEFSLEITIRE